MRENNESCPYCGLWHSSASHLPQFQKLINEIEDLKNKLNGFKISEHINMRESVSLILKLEEAMDFLLAFGQVDGSHHKMWVIDQTIRILTGEKYDDIIKMYRDGEDGENTHEWDCGIAP